MNDCGNILPQGWQRATIAELVGGLQYGFTTAAKKRSDGPRLLRITDINDGEVDWSTVPGCSISDEEFEKYKLADGDVVFARTGSIEKACALRKPPKAVFASYLIRGRPLDVQLAAWIHFFVLSADYVRQANGALLNQCLKSGIYYTTHHRLTGADYNPSFILRQCV